MIIVQNIKKEFTKTKENKEKINFLAVNDVSFKASSGKIIGILGPNGAGKTTLLRMIAGILKPTEGTISIDDLTYPHQETEIKKKMAYLSGNTRLYNSITGYELLKMCGEFYEVSKENIPKRIKEISNVLNLNEFLHNRIDKLSTGQVQRINIARCLIHNPQYYILDEATNGLDIISSQIILDFIKKEKAKGKTIIYSTHYMEEAENICDEVIMINKGKIIAQGTPQEINKQTKQTNLRDAFFALIKGEYDE